MNQNFQKVKNFPRQECLPKRLVQTAERLTRREKLMSSLKQNHFPDYQEHTV